MRGAHQQRKRQDIKQYLWDVHPMGTPSFIMLYTGHWETTSQLILKRIYLDEKFRRIDEPIEYDRGDNATIEFYERKEGEEFPNLQEELEYLSIRAYRFASLFVAGSVAASFVRPRLGLAGGITLYFFEICL